MSKKDKKIKKQKKLLKQRGARITELMDVCYTAYQVVGVLAADCDRFMDEDVQHTLSMLSELTPNDTILPFASKKEAQPEAKH
jgi:hypothetical protein